MIEEKIKKLWDEQSQEGRIYKERYEKIWPQLWQYVPLDPQPRDNEIKKKSYPLLETARDTMYYETSYSVDNRTVRLVEGKWCTAVKNCAIEKEIERLAEPLTAVKEKLYTAVRELVSMLKDAIPELSIHCNCGNVYAGENNSIIGVEKLLEFMEGYNKLSPQQRGRLYSTHIETRGYKVVGDKLHVHPNNVGTVIGKNGSIIKHLNEVHKKKLIVIKDTSMDESWRSLEYSVVFDHEPLLKLVNAGSAQRHIISFLAKYGEG